MAGHRTNTGACLGVALLVVLVGCVGGPTPGPDAGSEGSPTATETASTTPTPTVEAVEYPAGFGESGFTNVTAAIYGHWDALAATSFTSTTSHRGGESPFTIVIRGEPDRNRATRTSFVDGAFDSQVYYANGTAVQNGSRFYAGGESYRKAIVYDGQFEGIAGVELSDPTVERSDGRTLLNYTITGERSGHLLVAESGLIVAYRIELAQGGVITYRVTNVGNTTVDEPEWVEDAEG